MIDVSGGNMTKCELHTDTELEYNAHYQCWECWRCEERECPKCGSTMMGEGIWVCTACGYTYDWASLKCRFHDMCQGYFVPGEDGWGVCDKCGTEQRIASPAACATER